MVSSTGSSSSVAAEEGPRGALLMESGSPQKARKEALPGSRLGLPMAPLKLAVLCALLCQNTVYTLVRRYSMANLREQYDPQEVLLLGEVFKLVFSTGAMYAEANNSEHGEFGYGRLAFISQRSGKMFTLAAVYGVMNVLSYFAIRRVDAAVFTVCAQLKILTTAAFAVAVLRKRLSWLQWRSLTELCLGCVLVTVPQLSSTSAGQGLVEDPATFLTGLAAVLLEVSLSGFASIYFEKVIKTSEEQFGIWERNFQLALHSMALYILYDAVARVARSDFRMPFHDLSSVAALLAVLGGSGGLLVALTVKVADSVIKTLAVSASIVSSTLLSHFLLGGPLNLVICVGAVIVAMSVVNYAFDPTKK